MSLLSFFLYRCDHSFGWPRRTEDGLQQRCSLCGETRAAKVQFEVNRRFDIARNSPKAVALTGIEKAFQEGVGR